MAGFDRSRVWGRVSTVLAAVPAEATLFVGNSNSARDVDLAMSPSVRSAPLTVVANRGLAGIDGCVSTALGIALGLLGDERIRVEELEDAFGRGARLLRHGDHAREHPDRREQLHEIRGEGEEGADADLTLDRQPPAEREHRDLAEGRDRLQRRLIPRLEAHRAHP